MTLWRFKTSRTILSQTPLTRFRNIFWLHPHDQTPPSLSDTQRDSVQFDAKIKSMVVFWKCSFQSRKKTCRRDHQYSIMMEKRSTCFPSCVTRIPLARCVKNNSGSLSKWSTFSPNIRFAKIIRFCKSADKNVRISVLTCHLMVKLS